MSANTTIADSKKITITLPSVNFAVLSKKISDLMHEFFVSVYNPLRSNLSKGAEGASSRASRVKFPQMNKFKFDKKSLKIILPIIIGIIVIVTVANVVKALPDAKSNPISNEKEIVLPDTLATINLDRKFDFPLKDEKGKEVGSFEYVIESVSLQKQIIVQGQRATAVNNRVFLILNLKITNNLKQMIQLNTRDYMRLVVKSNVSEQLAPDIHNDPVEVQAISTKYTRVGIALDEVDAKKTIQLKVGEIDGEKQNIDLNFKY